jgi:hypothetical protein
MPKNGIVLSTLYLGNNIEEIEGEHPENLMKLSEKVIHARF